jgi:phenylacetate-coenzyme A ligase PaaK-like adenylate-forming protein
LRQTLRQQILTVGPDTFESVALAVFRYQAAFNPVYRAYLGLLNRNSETVTNLRQIPFLPIGFFKIHKVVTQSPDSELPDLEPTGTAPLVFASSGTTGQTTSRHLVKDADLYETVSVQTFEAVYGALENRQILALLPSYLERTNSSLVYMIQHFMRQSTAPGNGFYLNNLDELTEQLRQAVKHPERPVLFIGVTFALLDWAEQQNLTFLGQHPNLTVMETGGMKGRRVELLREEVHEILTTRLGVPTIHSEYGMTELLSQGYSTGDGVFRPGPTMRILLRDLNDPFTIYPNDYSRTDERRTGGINVIDLANLDSCAFVETQDLGQYAKTPGTFRVIGRFDNSDIRGCNLLVV